LPELIAALKYMSSPDTTDEGGQEAWTVNSRQHTLKVGVVMTLDRVLYDSYLR